MLIAHTEQRQTFISYEHSREALQKYRQHEKFFCPQCEQPVQLKIGKVNTPHFAHISNGACDRLFSEGESVLHLKGKVQLFEWLKKCTQDVMLEPYLTKLAQRPDLLVNKRIAIEFQCSPITYEKWLLRTNGYGKENIQALWLFQTPKKKQAIQGVQKISIPPIMQQVMTYPFNGLPYLVTYDANATKFMYWTNLLHLHGHTFVTKVQCLPLEKQHFPFYEPRLISLEDFKHYWQLYKKQCVQFMYQRLFRSKAGPQDLFLRSCYEMRFSLEEMPIYVGIPVRNAEAIPLFSIEWQMILHYFCRQLQLQPHELCKGKLQLFLHQLGVESTKEAIQAVKNYSAVIEESFHKGNFSNFCEEVYGHLFAIDTIC